MSDAGVTFSVSTWQQPMPPAPGPARARVIDRLADMIDALGECRLRIAVDGLTAAGIEEVDPQSFVETIVDNTDFENPRLIRPDPGYDN